MPDVNAKGAAMLIPFFISEFLKPLMPDQFVRPFCMPDAVHTPVLAEMTTLLHVRDLEVAIDVNPANGYQNAIVAMRDLIGIMTAKSLQREFPINTAVNIRFQGYSDIYLSPSQAG